MIRKEKQEQFSTFDTIEIIFRGTVGSSHTFGRSYYYNNQIIKGFYFGRFSSNSYDKTSIIYIGLPKVKHYFKFYEIESIETTRMVIVEKVDKNMLYALMNF